MARSIWKPIYQHRHVLKQVSAIEPKVWSRTSVITSKFLGKKVFVHNGKTFIAVRITSEKIGKRFGEFALTKHIGRTMHKPREKPSAGQKKTTKKK